MSKITKISELIKFLQNSLDSLGDMEILKQDPDSSSFADNISDIELSVVEVINHPSCDSFIKVGSINKFAQPFQTQLRSISCTNSKNVLILNL